MSTLETFRYTAFNEAGDRVSGSEKAPSASAAHLALLQRGLQPIDVKEHKNILKFEITKKMVSRKEVMHFSRQLSVFVEAGVPIMQALDLISEETTDKLLKKVLLDMIVQIQAGETFATAAASHPEAFPRVLRRRLGVRRADRNARQSPRGTRGIPPKGHRCSVTDHFGAHLSRCRHVSGRRHGRRPGGLRATKVQDVLRLAQRQAPAPDTDAAGSVLLPQHLVVRDLRDSSSRWSSVWLRCGDRPRDERSWTR